MNRVRLIAVIVAALVGLGVWHSARDQDTAPDRRPMVETPATHPPDRLSTHPAPSLAPNEKWTGPSLPPPDPPYHGLAIQLHSTHAAIARCQQMIREIATLGADTVMVSIDGFQRHVESTTIWTDPDRTLPDDALLSVFNYAHQNDLRVILMPKILLSEPRGRNWRGKIQPTSWDAWFAEYERFITRYARLAERGSVEVFIIGSELISTEKFTDQWRHLIARVRGLYGGRLSYSANWDHYRAVQFWDDLDLIGMTTYHKLADEPNPPVETLRQSWRDIRKDILAWQQTVERPLLFTEAGWCSQEGCSIEAWNYYRHQEATPEGLEEQRKNYLAFADVWLGDPAVGGIIWWEWTSKPAGPSDYGYTPKNKPAERVLREIFASPSRLMPSSGPAENVGRDAQ